MLPGNFVLSPGTQALVHKDKVELNSHPDLNDVLAWKDGKFSFNAAGIMDVMNELARWYDYLREVRRKYPAAAGFTGKIGMDLQLSEVLELLRKNDIQFSLRDKVL